MSSANSGPAITSTQMDMGAIGNIGKSVNMFRGDATFPVTFLQLAGPNGLDVSIGATYGSNVASEAGTWNRDAPTGVLGLGWDMPIDCIEFGSSGGTSKTAARYALNSQGSASALIPIAVHERDGLQCYEFGLGKYQAWRILYFPAAERWEVLQESGIRYVYGDSASGRGTVQWAVSRDNWIGNSATDAGQQFAVAWNLSEIRHGPSDAITFGYANDDVPVSAGSTLCYTRASRLASVIDAYGRVVTCSYLPKEPSEYAPQHGTRQNDAVSSGYQQRYETHYLAGITVTSPAGRTLWQVALGYELSSVSNSSTPEAFVKRYLVSAAQGAESTTLEPGVAFGYFNAPAEDGAPAPNAPGSLATVTYPTGATVSFEYGSTQFASRALTVDRPGSGGVPRVWFGSDYIVVTWYDDDSAQLSITAYAWSGSWSAWSADSTFQASISDGGSSLSVVASSEFFAVTWLDDALVPSLILFRRSSDRFGQWIQWNPDDSYAAAPSGAPPGQLAVGDTFVVFNPSGSSTLYRYSWDRTAASWDSQTLTQQASRVLIAARSNLFVAMAFDGGSGTMTLQSVDMFGHWSAADFPGSIAIQADQDGEPLFAWGLGGSFAAASYVSPGGLGVSSIDYTVAVYHWDEGFSSLSCKTTQSFSTTIALGLPYTLCVVKDALIGNLNNLLRYDGSQWQVQQLPCENSQQYGSLFAYGEDIGVAANLGGQAAGYAFDADQIAFETVALSPGTTNGSLPPRVTASQNLLSVGIQLYTRDPDTGWTALTSLSGQVNQDSIANRAPNFFAYEVGSGSDAQATILLIKNGQAVPSDSSLLQGQRIYADKQDAPGTLLCGESAFVTYSGSDFDSVDSLCLFHVANGDIDVQTHAPVVSLGIDDGYSTTVTAYWYDTSVATFDDSSTVAQYARVRSFQGLTSAPPDGTPSGSSPSPHGYTESLFYNGMAPGIAGLFYPDDTANYYTLLSGNPLLVRDFDSQNRVASCRITRYEKVVPSALPSSCLLRTRSQYQATLIAPAFSLQGSDDIYDFLNGVSYSMPGDLAQAFANAGYLLSDQVVPLIETPSSLWLLLDEQYFNLYIVSSDLGVLEVSAGFSRGESTSCEPAYGLLTSATTFNRNGSGEAETRVRSIVYAWQQLDGSGEPRYPEMLRRHLLNAVTDATESVNGAVTARTITLYDNDWGAHCDAWLQRSTYDALNADADYAFDAGTLPDPSSWQRTSQIVSRNRRGEATETIDVAGIHSSSLFDKAHAMSLVQVQNASVGNGEVAYYGAEAYEQNPGWAMQPGAGAPVVSAGLAHTGTQSILLGPNPAASLVLQQDVTPSQGCRRYVFTCRYLTDAGFGSDSGEAAVQVTVSTQGVSATTSSEPFSDSRGDWLVAMVSIDPVQLLALDAPPDTVSIEISICNGKSSTSLHLDELRFIPQISAFSGIVADPVREVATAQLTQTAQAYRSAFLGKTPCASIDAGGFVSAVQLAWLSRSGHCDGYSSADPNIKLSIAPAGPGRFQDYRRCSDWNRYWQGDAARWTVQDGALSHTAAQSDTLTLIDSPTAGDAGMLLRLRPQGRVSQPLSLAYGDVLVEWIPGSGATDSGCWRYGGDASTDASPAASCVLDSRYGPVLDGSATVPPALRAQLASLGVWLRSSTVGITVVGQGTQWLLDDTESGQAYRVDAGSGGLTVTCLTLSDQQLLFVLAQGAVLFYAGGRQVFQYPLESGCGGAFSLTTSDLIELQDVLVFERPRLSCEYLDGCGRTVQSQKLECVPSGADSASVNCVVEVYRYDGLGRQALATKAIRYDGTLFGYQAAAITAIDPDTGQLQGDCNDYYSSGGGGFSDDGGYPYCGTRYGDRPSASAIEQGLPGTDLAITSGDPRQHHTTRSLRTPHRSGDAFAALNLASGDYVVSNAVDADGNPSFQLRDKCGNSVAESAALDGTMVCTSYAYDSAGRLLLVRPPNAQADAASDALCLSATYDFVGQRLTESRPDSQGPTRYAYDTAGRLRLSQDAAGAAAVPPYAQYRKYDRLGRCIETGYVPFDWNDLAEQAEDPAWPPSQAPRSIELAPPQQGQAQGVWRTAWIYDGDGTSPLQLGQAATVYSSNGTDGSVDVTERRRYDAQGRVLAKTLIVAAWGSDAYTSEYVYDTMGSVAAIRYPDGCTQVFYGYDSLGRLVTIGNAAGDASIASYTYTATSAIESETLGSGAGAVSRRYGYTSPGWIASIDDPFLRQSVAYAATGGQTYYNGRIAATGIDYLWSGAPAGIDYQFKFDSLGRLLTAQNDVIADGNLGVAVPLAYDGNGNIETMSQGAVSVQYTYDGSSNRVTADGLGGTYQYDANGAIVQAGSAGFAGCQLSEIDYDPCTRMVRSIGIAAGPTTQVQYDYDSSLRRVLKRSTTQDGSDPALLYLHGTGASPLMELTRSGSQSATSCVYVYGPRGLIGMTRGGDAYLVLTDYLGSTRAVVAAQTGATVAQFDYSPFGNVVRTSGDASVIRYLYTGQEYEPETGLYNYRARLYDSQLARFYSVDPLGQYASPYCYVGNDPTGFTDPTGLLSKSQKGGLLGSIIGVAIGLAEILVGAAMVAFGGPLSKVVGGALIGAGIHGIITSVLHPFTLDVSGYVRGEVVGAAFGALGGFFHLLRRPGDSIALRTVGGMLRDSSRVTEGALSAIGVPQRVLDAMPYEVTGTFGYSLMRRFMPSYMTNALTGISAARHLTRAALDTGLVGRAARYVGGAVQQSLEYLSLSGRTGVVREVSSVGGTRLLEGPASVIPAIVPEAPDVPPAVGGGENRQSWSQWMWSWVSAAGDWAAKNGGNIMAYHD